MFVAAAIFGGTKEMIMTRLSAKLLSGLTFATFAFNTAAVHAQGAIKIGALLPMTGPSQSVGAQITAAIRLYMAQHGDVVAGKKIQVIVKDDGAVADTTKRLAQELIVNEKVNFVAGFGVTPTAFAVAPLATEAKIPQIVMAAGTSSITERSPYVVRTSFTLAQSCVIIADWALKNGIKRVVSIVSDYGPGIDSERFFKDTFLKGGGEITQYIRTPFANPDFAPSCSVPVTTSRTRSLPSCRPANLQVLYGSLLNAASTRQASRLSVPVT
jgi:ABC-type branched-subunit amino acid transport system substrate-binding protein